MRFDEIIGKKITISLASSDQPYVVKLRSAETGGIWVESQKLAAMLGYQPSAVQRPKTTKPPKLPVLFIPYSQIVFAVYLSTELAE
jgi:hypothetical protein